MPSMSDSNELPPIIDSLTAPTLVTASAIADKQPPLSIVHLMAWITGSAFILTGYRLLEFDRDSTSPSIMIAFQSLNAMIQGAAMASVGLWAWRRMRGGARFPVAPGHYLLCIIGCNTVLQWGLIFLWLAGTKAQGIVDQYRLGYLGIYSASQFLEAGLLVYAGMSISRVRHWSMALLALAGSSVLRMLQSLAYLVVFAYEQWPIVPLLSYLDKLPGSLTLAAVGIACFIDLWRSQQRDWLHWLGVVIVAAGVASQWGFQLVMWLVTSA